MSVINTVKDLFVEEERNLLNVTIKQGMSKDEILEDLSMTYDLNDDEDYKELVDDVMNKVTNLSEDELSYLISVIPLEVPYTYVEDDALPEEEYE